MPLIRRIPKRGFTNIFRKEYTTVNLKALESIKTDVITPEVLLEEGIIRGYKDGVKILGEGQVARPFVLKAHKFSKGAREKILSAGGKVEVI